MAVAAVIDEAVRRPDDFAARYGGEEFVVVLPNTDRRGAASIAEAIREKTRALLLKHSGTKEGIVTVSIGVASAMPRSGHATREHLIRDADAALYNAKEDGRDAVRVGNVLPADFERQVSRAR